MEKLIVLGLVCIVVSYIAAKAFCKYDYSQIQKNIDEFNRSRAIRKLSEVRGRILEVKDLSSGNIPQNILLDELESISSSNFSDNKYLDDFALNSPTSDIIGEICEEYISQIDAKIYTIWYKE